MNQKEFEEKVRAKLIEYIYTMRIETVEYSQAELKPISDGEAEVRYIITIVGLLPKKTAQ